MWDIHCKRVSSNLQLSLQISAPEPVKALLNTEFVKCMHEHHRITVLTTE